MTCSSIFYLFKENPERFSAWLNERHTTNRVLDLTKSEVSEEQLSHYAIGGAFCPITTINGEYRYFDSQILPETYLDFQDIKKFTRDEQYKTPKRDLFFTCSHALRGKTGSLLARKKKITLAVEGVLKTETLGEMHQVYYVDEKPPKKFIKQKSVDYAFNVYQFVTWDGQNVIALSEDLLPSHELIIEGNLIHLEDLSQIGQVRSLNVKLPLFIVTKAHTGQRKLCSLDDCQNLLQEHSVTGQAWFEYLFSHDKRTFTHKQEFATLVSAFVLASKKDGYPLHVIVIGPPGTGKTTILESLQAKLEPERPIVEGSSSTVKALVPSFKNTLPEPGALIQSVRVVSVDEFFRLLQRGNADQRQDLLTCMNSLLEHRERTFASGNGLINSKMTSRLIAVSNPPSVDTMEELCNKIDNSFLSRMLIWWQDYTEIIGVRENNKPTPYKAPSYAGLLRDVADYLQQAKATYDCEKVDAVYQLGKRWVREGVVRDVYSARYGKHHIHCLIDGIIKTRFVISGGDLTATREDYAFLLKVWRSMLEGWNCKPLGLDGFSRMTTEVLA